MTQQDVADKSGVTRTTVSKIEAGKFNAGVDIVDRLARAMGASLDIVPAEEDDR
jgi:transcriptional regulator with XRE-family HTH domain